VRFVANLRDRTIEAFGRHGVQPDAYLLSTHRLSPAALAHAHALRDDAIPIVADNGSKEFIDELIADFREPAAKLRVRVRDLRHTLGHTPRGSEVPKSLRADASALAQQVVAAATRLSAQVDTSALIDAQMSMRPTHLVAQEDFATTCLIALNLEREVTGWPVSAFVTRNRRSLSLWQAVASDPRTRDATVYAVLSAVDYNTARAAGRLAAQAGVRDVAIGCAGLMLDATAIDFHTIGTGTWRLARPVARRYVRLAQVFAGLRDGFASVDQPLRSLHALGLGAAALLPLFAAASPGNTELATDATSPIHDAVRDRVLYDLDHHGSRRTIVRLVDELLNGSDWSCGCPFCTTFRSVHGHDAERALAAWQDAGSPAVNRALLDDLDSLAKAIPLFAGKDEDRHASRTHIAHNHWVLGAVARETPRGSTRFEWALDRMQALRTGASLTVDRGLEAAETVLGQIASTSPASHASPGSPASRESQHAAPQTEQKVIMKTLTLTDLTHTLSAAARDGAMRIKLVATVASTLRAKDASLRDRNAAIASAWADGPGALRAAFDELFIACNELPKIHDLINTTLAVQRRTDAALGEVEHALQSLTAVARVDGLESVVTAETAGILAGLPATADHSLPASVLLGLPRHPPAVQNLERRLADWSSLRLWALHGLVLLAIVAATPEYVPDSTATLASDRADVEARVRALRDSLREIASVCQQSGVVSPRDLLALWATAQNAEEWIRDTGCVSAAQASAIATAAASGSTADAERLSRDAALIYDGVRNLLGLLSGAHAAIRAYTLSDTNALSAFTAIAALPVSPATLDLPRTSIAQAVSGKPGDVIETAALVIDSSVTAGGPAPRTVLDIGTQTGARLKVLIPFIAADSFGVTPGVWVQVRGTLFPHGKSGLTGPVLEVRRIRREAASASSAFDALIWSGRSEFTLRPGQLDIVAGRRAGSLTTAAELGLRRRGG
jgi:hypothetical protein